MADKKKNLDLKATYGTFQFVGFVDGMLMEKAYVSKGAADGKRANRRLKFALKVNKDMKLFLELGSSTMDEVTFQKLPAPGAKFVKGVKAETTKIKWDDRMHKPDGWEIFMGVKCGVEQKTDEKGVVSNDQKVFHPYDATEYLFNHLKDGMPVFVKGKVEFGHYDDHGEIKRTTKFIPDQISFKKDLTDFDQPDFSKMEKHVFKQHIIFTDWEKMEGGKVGFNLISKIVNYNSVDVASFSVVDKDGYNYLHKVLKPYYSFNVWGDVIAEKNTEEEKATGWGVADPTKLKSPYKMRFIITGADAESEFVVDDDGKQFYTEEKIDAAIAAMNATATAVNEFSGKSAPGTGFGSSAPIDDDELWG